MKLTEEQSQMVADNIKLAYKFAHKFHRLYPTVELETLTDLCIDGLIDAVRKVDKDRGKLSTCVHWYCRSKVGHYFTALNTDKRRGQEISVESVVPYTEDAKYIDKYGRNDEYLFFDKAEVVFYTKGLTDKERDVINRYYFLQQPQRAIGEAINKDQTTTGLLIRKAVQKMNAKYKVIEGC